MGDTYSYKYLLEKYIAHVAAERGDDIAFRCKLTRYDIGELEYGTEDQHRLEDIFEEIKEER